ncbi:MAG: hypothetical protein IKK75_12475 [Clostridia bacterium]|nr:hypothetical protein [Clostridia bacterium]
MLEAIMQITFFAKNEAIYEAWLGYDARRTFRPVFNLGGRLFSANITSNELMYYWDKEYSVCVQFFTIDTPSLYSAIADELVAGKTYNIQMGSKVIGQAVLLDYCYSE